LQWQQYLSFLKADSSLFGNCRFNWGLPPKSERTILKNAEDIEGKEKHVLSHCDARQKHGAHSGEGLTLYENLKTLGEELFKAACGWFRRFEANFWFENVRVQIRTASPDIQAAGILCSIFFM
jgi:hypothetical protein